VFIDDLAERLTAQSTKPWPNNLLFADDIEIIADDFAEAQGLCDIISIWTLENGMEVGIKKCGQMGVPSGASLELSGAPIPTTSRYKYLGFIHSVNGLEIQEHVDSMTRKADSLLQQLERQGRQWAEGVKLAVYKTFVRPILDWGAQLWYHNLPNIEALEAIQKRALKWIMPFSVHASITASVVAIPPLLVRAEGLAVSFVGHCAVMPEDHPLRRLKPLLGQGPWPNSCLSPRILKSPLRDRLLEDDGTPQIPLSTKVRMWLLDKCMELAKAGKYMSSRSRARRLGTDRTVYWKDREARQLALRWRVGSFGCRLQCPRGHGFNRGCIARGHIGATIVPYLPHTPPDDCPLYCGIDEMINNQAEAHCRQVLSELLRTLQQRSAAPDPDDDDDDAFTTYPPSLS
jgi:hypothetical protein